MLEKYSFLDVESALPFSGDDEDIYEVVVATYVEDEKVEELTKAFENSDWANYRIIVHAIKSSSYTIGANELGDEAKESEDCLKNGDIEGAKARFPKLIGDYKNMLDKIKNVIEM